MAKIQGLKLNIVRDGGEAHKANLQAGDILIAQGGRQLTTPQSLADARASQTNAEDIIFVRDGKSFVVSVAPGKLDVSYVEAEVVVSGSMTPERYSANYTQERAQAVQERIADMIVTTAHHVDGYVVAKQLGVITAECVFGLNVFKDFFASISDVFGGRSNTTQQALRDARETCIKELKKEAAERGANAVIAVDLDYSEFSGQGKSMLFIVASGTAVYLDAKNSLHFSAHL